MNKKVVKNVGFSLLSLYYALRTDYYASHLDRKRDIATSVIHGLFAIESFYDALKEVK